jgi:hypothetical protein
MRAAVALLAAVCVAACEAEIDEVPVEPGRPVLPDDPLTKDASLMAWLSPQALAKPQMDVGADDRVRVLRGLPGVLAPPADAVGPTLLVGSPDEPARLRFQPNAALELQSDYDSLADELTIAAVVRPEKDATQGRIAMLGAGLGDEEVALWRIDGAQLQALRVTDADDFTFALHDAAEARYQIVVLTAGRLPGSLNLFVDGHSAGKATVQGSPGSLAYVARTLTLNHPATPTQFDLGELLVFKRRLERREIDALDAWLGARWNLTTATLPPDDVGTGPVTFAAVEGILTGHHCTGCHYRGSTVGSTVVLADYDGVRAVVTPGEPAQSRLYNAIDRMGQKTEATPLAAAEKQAIADWIQQGAPQQ